MKLKELSLPDCEQVRQWRNKNMAMLRTPFMLTEEMQEDFYHNVVSNRNSNARYWGVWEDGKIKTTHYFDNTPAFNTESDGIILIGMVGLENISWENRNAEISIILNPDYQHKGYGTQAVDLLLDQGFNYLNLENIYAECYECNPALGFWHKMTNKYADKYNPKPVWLANRKYWQGKYYDSLYVNFEKERLK
jgi:RimJ/RimL family protein N-acetyltransferase